MRTYIEKMVAEKRNEIVDELAQLLGEEPLASRDGADFLAGCLDITEDLLEGLPQEELEKYSGQFECSIEKAKETAQDMIEKEVADVIEDHLG